MVWIAGLLLLVVTVSGDITGTNPPVGACLCMTTGNINIRETACGKIIGSTTADECWKYQGNIATCSLGENTDEFFHVDFRGQNGWITGDSIALSQDGMCGQPRLPDTEFRAFWVATVTNIDWPMSSSDSVAEQQDQLMNYLNIMQELNMNALFFQIRTAGDALYPSTIEPWSKYMTGTQGTPPNPLWDPLQFLVIEAHRRNIEVHAWLNPYRANLSPNWDGLTPNHMANRYREHAHPYGNYLWMDPGAEEVVDHLLAVISDVENRYDIDGIHFDDYFYPYPDGSEFPDNITWTRYLDTGGSLSRNDWRRDNVNKMIERVHDTIKSIKGHVKFTISPFGIYRAGHPEGIPSPIVGFDPYTSLYADTKLWLQEGWCDAWMPQLYWEIEPPAQSYPVLLDWWLSVNPFNRHVYAGNGVYKTVRPSTDWPVSEIENQVTISRERQSQLSLGNCLFSAKYFRDNNKGIRERFRTDVYPNVVQIPPMPWLNNTKPEAPKILTKSVDFILWDQDITGVTWSWAVYKITGNKWDLIKIQNKTTTWMNTNAGVYGIIALSRTGVASAPSIVSATQGKMLG